MSGKPTARQAMKSRTGGELRFSLMLTPPGEDVAQQLEVDLRGMTLSERQLAKRALAKMVEPSFEEVILVHAWVVWRRTHPTASLQTWMDDITFGDLLDGIDFEPDHVLWDTTPEGFDPEA